ncbi:unnamed protein product, partial [Allacma fusca]
MLQLYKMLFCFGISTLFYQHGESSGYSIQSKLCTGCRVYINETRKCYQNEFKGPCGEMMVVMNNSPDTEVGKCVCQIFACGGRPTVHWIQQNRCYFIFEQGPCPSGHWLVPNDANVATCEKIPCPEEYKVQRPPNAGRQFLFPHEGKCYTSGIRGAGPCPPNEAAYFYGMKYTCMEYSSYCGNGASISSGSSDCEDGSEPDTFDISVRGKPLR